MAVETGTDNRTIDAVLLEIENGALVQRPPRRVSRQLVERDLVAALKELIEGRPVYVPNYGLNAIRLRKAWREGCLGYQTVP